MGTLPELIEEDVQEINQVLKSFLANTEAIAAMLTAEGGFLIMQQGDTSQFDAGTLSALAANAYNATQAIAALIQEPNFTHVLQQGKKFSMLVSDVDQYHTLIVLFPASISVGVVKYFAGPAAQSIARQLQAARERAPGNGIDVAMLNLADATVLFKQKAS
jgi:predicted regulator of Ras-like GTPase activity (Roadblock/LC7/MglB family)